MPNHQMPTVNLRFRGDPEGLLLVQRGGDLDARLMLIDMGEAEWLEGNFEAASTLLHAMFYLEDRTAYELCPPPYRMAIPVAFFMGKGYAWQAARELGIGVLP